MDESRMIADGSWWRLDRDGDMYNGSTGDGPSKRTHSDNATMFVRGRFSTWPEHLKLVSCVGENWIIVERGMVSMALCQRAASRLHCKLRDGDENDENSSTRQSQRIFIFPTTIGACARRCVCTRAQQAFRHGRG